MARQQARQGARNRRKGPTPRSRPAASSEPPPKPTVSRIEARQYRRRPRWHRIAGLLSIVAGIAIIVINDLGYADLALLPGGHSEGYFLLGVAVAASGSWWLGFFDRRK